MSIRQPKFPFFDIHETSNSQRYLAEMPYIGLDFHYNAHIHRSLKMLHISPLMMDILTDSCTYSYFLSSCNTRLHM